MNNGTLTGNLASSGGGAYNGTLNNCILYFNIASSNNYYYADDSFGDAINYCCTTPAPNRGAGNITNEPLFVDRLNGNLRLQSNSPCINAGFNASASGPADLDGNPRIIGGTVDMGAYERHLPTRFATLRPPGPGGVELNLTGETGSVLDLYASSNLVIWLWLARLTNMTGQMNYTDPLSPRPPARFYKAVSAP